MQVGFVGLGRMGSRMAANISQAGLQLAVYNRTRHKAEALASEVEATVADSPRTLAAESDVVVSMVSDGPALRAVYEGPDGILEGLAPGKVAVDMSTVGPERISELAPKVGERGAELLDAPVSGSVAVAEAGKLMIMVGGTEQGLARARPVLEAVGEPVLHVGSSGAGATLKLAVNSIVFGFNQALSEALVLAEKAGVDRSTAYDVFEKSAVAAPVLVYRRPVFENPGHVPVTFTMDLAAKDLRLILDLADRVGTPMPQAEENLGVYQRASEAGFGADDMGAVAEFLRRGG